MAESPLESIGFAEFTTNLVLKVFDGLVAANLRQMEAYAQLVQALSKTLAEYVGETKDNDISGAEILQFLAPFAVDSTGQPELVADGVTLQKRCQISTNCSSCRRATAAWTRPGTAIPPPPPRR